MKRLWILVAKTMIHTACVFAFGLLAAGVQAQACRQALVLALDVSGSVNAVEYRQQTEGLAAALNAADVRDLILLGADAPINLAVFEWSSQNHQYIIQPWVRLDSAAALDATIARIRAHRPVRAGLKTAMGTSLAFAAGLLDQKSECWELTIDVSGDGIGNIGPTPRQAYTLDSFDRITVNALVVGAVEGVSTRAQSRSEELRRYFETDVIHGPQAFAMVAYGYADYADAMRRKLIRELSVPIVGFLSEPSLP